MGSQPNQLIYDIEMPNIPQPVTDEWILVGVVTGILTKIFADSFEEALNSALAYVGAPELPPGTCLARVYVTGGSAH